MMNLFNLVWNFLLILIFPIPVLLILVLPILVLPILIPFILIILICILYMNKFSLALCYMKCRQKNNSSQGSSNLTGSTISKLTFLERIKPFLLGLVLIVSFISYILLIDKPIQPIYKLIIKAYNFLLNSINSNLNHLKTLWKFLKSLWTLINAPFSLLLSASVLLHLQSKRNRIKKIILEDNEKHLKDVVILNKDLLYWLHDNLLEISETIDQIIAFNGVIESLKVKPVGMQNRKEIEVNKLNAILTELFAEPNLTVADSYFAGNKNIFNMYNTLKQLKKDNTLQKYFTAEGINAQIDDINRDTILDLIKSYYYLFLGWKALAKFLYTPQKVETINNFLESFIKKIDKFP